MLILSRHRDESIIIGDNIVVTVVDIRGDKVRLGIDASQDIPVHRQEVYDAIKRNEAAAESQQEDAEKADSYIDAVNQTVSRLESESQEEPPKKSLIGRVKGLFKRESQFREYFISNPLGRDPTEYALNYELNEPLRVY